jgi:hypothetical protein
MLLLAEGQTGEGWEPSHKQRFSVNRGAKIEENFHFFPLASQAPSSCMEVEAIAHACPTIYTSQKYA